MPTTVWQDIFHASYHIDYYRYFTVCWFATRIRRNYYDSHRTNHYHTRCGICYTTNTLGSLWAFRSSAHTPLFVNYLGRVLPPAIFAMLVVYCYKDVDFLTPSYGISEIISGICVIIIQMLFKNMAYSILLGSGLYILLVN